ncbi:hypothetical protein N0V84_005613 [Fusarium piperis]|uniref:Uncharacterized protein n=1 Tax=Fusarium piperis TaxID=1435070 RepID=A0A9W8WDF0_9HYPO|nr:hypothetical protein N0V84_005613 [Fusarium piperis]
MPDPLLVADASCIPFSLLFRHHKQLHSALQPLHYHTQASKDHIQVRVYQNNTNAYFHIVEKGCWHYAKGAEWSEHNGIQTLTMGDSGTSGMLRFKTEQGKEAFFIAMGVHNYKPWVDIVTGLADDVTCVKALPEYYGNASERTRSRESQRTEQSILNIDRRTIATNYKVSQGNDLELDIIIN